MRPRPSSTFVALLAAVLPIALTAQTQSAQPELGGAAFLLIPVGARAAALGQAAVADGGTSEAAFWNPAGLASMPSGEFSVQRANTFVSNNTAISAYLVNDRLGTVGIAGYLVDYGSQTVVPRFGGTAPVGEFSPKNIELLASYATDVAGSFLFGVNYKLIQFRQDCQGACGNIPNIVGTTHAVDVGVQFAPGGGALRVGVALRNAGFKLQLENRDQADPLPTRVQAGVSYRVMLPAARPGAPQMDARVLLDLQDDWGNYSHPDTRVGLELGYGDLVRLRTGYAFLNSENSGPSIGIGLRYERFSVDFARIFYTSGSFDEPVFLGFRVGI